MSDKCDNQDTCLDFSDGSKRRGHHIRLVNCCIFWVNDRCDTDAIIERWEVAGKIGKKRACEITKGGKNVSK